MTHPGFRKTDRARRRQAHESVARLVLAGLTAAMLAPLIAIAGFLLYQAAPVLSWEFVLQPPSDGMRAGGVWPALLGTIYLVLTALVIATPVGVLAAVYLNEYARESWFTRVVNLAVLNLAGIPSIVHALFGLGAFVAFAGLGRSILAASLTLAVMTMPVIIASTKEALASVPRSFREACWNAGLTRWQTVRHVVLPNAVSGILTGVIFQVSRTAGETAPIMFTGAVFYKSLPQGDLFRLWLVRSMHGFVDAPVHHFHASARGSRSRRLWDGRCPAWLRAWCQRARHRGPDVPPDEEAMVNSPAILVKDLSVWYGARAVVDGISFEVPRQGIFAVIGPAQSGKTSMLRVFNRTLEFTPGARWTGAVSVLGRDVAGVADVHALRRQVGMVAPLPVGLPLSIFDNVALAPRMAGALGRAELADHVERCLRQAALWDEVKDRLADLGTKLSGGQQQRLALARALSHSPEVLCLDEFSIAIDPVTTMRIEDILVELSARITIVLVTNLIQQARRIAGQTMFLLNGRVVECGPTGLLFSESPACRATYDYVRGEFG